VPPDNWEVVKLGVKVVQGVGERVGIRREGVRLGEREGLREEVGEARGESVSREEEDVLGEREGVKVPEVEPVMEGVGEVEVEGDSVKVCPLIIL